MLIIEENSVYEIDEDCIRQRNVPKECHTLEKIQKRRQFRASSGYPGNASHAPDEPDEPDDRSFL